MWSFCHPQAHVTQRNNGNIVFKFMSHPCFFIVYLFFKPRKPTSGVSNGVSFSNRGMNQPVCKLRNLTEAVTQTESSITQQNGSKKKGFSNRESSCHSQFVRTYGMVESIRVSRSLGFFC